MIRQFGVAVEGGMEHVPLRARVHIGEISWLIGVNCSNAFKMVIRTAVLPEGSVGGR